MLRPLFLTFEGLDGAGKTTQIEMLAAHLQKLGREVRIYREPGGTHLGERIRALLLDDGTIAPWAEASLFAASRAQLVAEEIAPCLESGIDVLCDRYVDSSVAYQGVGRSLGTDEVRTLNSWVTGGLLPDKTFLLMLPAEDATSRIHTQLSLFTFGETRGAEPKRAAPDRLERESIVFRRRVEDAYRQLAASAPDRFVAIDARMSPKRIARDIRGVAQRLISGALRAAAGSAGAR